jgi:hypothetical protein
MHQIKDEITTLDASYGSVTGLEWTEDGQILTVGTSSGAVLNFLARMPTIVDASGLRVAYMSSLRELSVVDTFGDAPPVTLPISVEPSFVALGPRHVAVGMNNQVWYYAADATTKGLVNEKEYLSTVDAVKLTSQYACVLSEGRISIHPIDPSGGGDRGSVVRVVVSTSLCFSSIVSEREADGSVCVSLLTDPATPRRYQGHVCGCHRRFLRVRHVVRVDRVLLLC